MKCYLVTILVSAILPYLIGYGIRVSDPTLHQIRVEQKTYRFQIYDPAEIQTSSSSDLALCARKMIRPAKRVEA